MKNNRTPHILSICFLLFFFMVVGCAQTVSQDGITPTEDVISTKVAPEATQVVKPTEEPKIPIPTPMPTLSDIEAAAIIEKVLTSDYYCRLPCFGGITPGETKTEWAEAFFSTFSQRIFKGPTRPVSFTAYLTPPERYDEREFVMAVFFSDEEGFIEVILGFRYNYSVGNLLSDYGSPAEVYIYVRDTLPIDPSGDFELILYYPDHGIMASYEGITGKGKVLEICPSNTLPVRKGPFLWLWSPSKMKSIEDFASSYGRVITDLHKYHRISEISELDVERFYALYQDPNNDDDCFQIRNPYISNN